MHVGILSVGQHLLNQLAVASVNEIEPTEGGGTSIAHLGLFH